jgi:hypothetical protein
LVAVQTFLSLGDLTTRQRVFYLYAALAMASLVFFVARLPETRGKSLEEVQAQLSSSRGVTSAVLRLMTV